MSNFYNKDRICFLSNIHTPQKQYSNNYFDNTNIESTKLFKDINQNKKANIFFNKINDLSNFNEKNYNSQNIYENKYISNNFNLYNYKDSTIGTTFKGYYSKINKENVYFMSITSIPEFSHGSYEEFRLADFEKKKTGNIIYYKVKNTSSLNNNFFSNNKGVEINNYSYNSNNYFLENSGNNNVKNNNSDNIFNRKLESKLFKFKNNSNYQRNDNTLFKSNIVEEDDNNNHRNKILFPKISNYNSPFSYLKYNSNNNNFLRNSQNLHQNFQANKTNNNNNNNKEEFNKTYDDIELYKLLSPNKKLTKEINEAIKSQKTVKEFLEDLCQEYKKSKNLEILNDNNSFISQNNSFTSDIYGSYLSKSSNSNGAKIEFNNSFNEIEISNMEVENDINYNKLASKINNIYNINNGSNNIFKGSNNINNYRNSKLNIINEDKNENEYIFNKTFTNGFPNYNSLLKNPFIDNTLSTKKNPISINNISLTNNRNSNEKHIRNNNNIYVGRDETLYQKNLRDLNELSISKLNLNENSDNITKNLNENDSNIFSVNNNEGNNNYKMQNMNLNINYNLFEEGKKEKSQNIIFHKILLENINPMKSVKDLKEQIKHKVYAELKKKSIYNYSIQKITLLTYFQFLEEDNILLNYKLDTFDYTLLAYISYKINKYVPKLTKIGYKCYPSISELSQKSSEELKKVEKFKIFNKYGEVEFKEPVNLLGVNLDKEITIEKNMIDTSDKFNYWSIFKLYHFIASKEDLNNYRKYLENSGGRFISYENNVLIWEYKGKSGDFS